MKGLGIYPRTFFLYSSQINMYKKVSPGERDFLLPVKNTERKDTKRMALQQILQKSLDDWKAISNLDFCLLDQDNQVYVSTCTRPLPTAAKLAEFRESSMMTMANAAREIHKIMENDKILYLLIVWGTEDQVSTIGKLAVCQVSSLLTAYAEKNDKNIFMQNLLLSRYSEVEIFNRAKKLHISTMTRRAVLVVETKKNRDEGALATIRNLFSARTRDFITAMDDSGIIIIHEMQAGEDYSTLEELAYMLVDMLNTEVMTSAWVGYSNTSEDIKQLANAYKEARTALEVGKIFYAEKNVFGYNELGIGRLIYQLPVSICEMFLREVFEEENVLDSLDEETVITIRTFFENNLNLSETSRNLYVHRNTLVYRFEKLQKKLGLDIRAFEDAMTFQIAMMVTKYIKNSREK